VRSHNLPLNRSCTQCWFSQLPDAGYTSSRRPNHPTWTSRWGVQWSSCFRVTWLRTHIGKRLTPFNPGLVNVILYTFTRNIFPLPTILSKLSFRARSNFHRLSHGNLSLPISVSAQDSGILEKTSSNGSEAMSSRTLSPIHSRPDTAQSDLTVANANPFTDAVVDNVVASPVPSHQRQSDGKLRTFSLVKVNSISSASSSSSRRGTIGPAKDGRTVIKKPHRAVLSDGSWYGSSGTGKGKPVETRSLEV